MAHGCAVAPRELRRLRSWTLGWSADGRSGGWRGSCRRRARAALRPLGRRRHDRARPARCCATARDGRAAVACLGCGDARRSAWRGSARVLGAGRTRSAELGMPSPQRSGRHDAVRQAVPWARQPLVPHGRSWRPSRRCPSSHSRSGGRPASRASPEHQVGAGRHGGGEVDLHHPQPAHHLEQVGRARCVEQLGAHGDAAGLLPGQLVGSAMTLRPHPQSGSPAKTNRR